MKFPAYPKYKPSGVEWLGDVPENWDVTRSDAIVSADRSQLSPEAFADRDVYHYSIPIVQVTGAGQVENGESIASAKQVIKKPVILVSKLNPRKATICLAKPQAILTLCSTEFVALNADKCDLAFLEYLTRSELFRQGLDSKVQSVTRSHQRANPADIYKFWNAWPSMNEQRAIADFLDAQTARLDALLTKRQALIEKLAEKRTSLISLTVTRGLNSNIKFTPSGVEWLGDMPAHWQAKPLKYVASIKTGFAFSADEFTDEGIPVLRIGDITQDGKVDLSGAKCLPADFLGSNHEVIVRKHDIVMAMTGATIGKVARAAVADEAIKWATLAANQGDKQGQANLAQIYFEGKFVKQDFIEAYKWGDLAAKNPALEFLVFSGSSFRDAAILKMDANQIAEARRRVAAFIPHQPQKSDLPEPAWVQKIKLEGITGTPGHRFALINKKTFGQGDQINLKVGEKRVTIQCIEIRESTVVISIEGLDGTRELKMP